MKQTKRLFSILVVLAMLVSMIPNAFAAQVTTLPLLSKDGNYMVADEDTLCATVFQQDPETKLITATITVTNNTKNGQALTLNGVGVQIRFDGRVAPYNPVDGAYSGGATTVLSTVSKYIAPKFANFKTISAGVLQNDENLRVIGFKIGTASALETDVLQVAPGATVEVASIQFVPQNGTDALDLNMFGYQYAVSGMYKLSTWIGNGTRYFAADELAMSGTYTYYISNSAFKVHVKHAMPTGLAADEIARVIEGYGADTMEWSTEETGTYQSGLPLIGDEAQTIYVRVKGDEAYSQTSPDGKYVDYKRYIPSDPVGVSFQAAFYGADPLVTKVSSNLTATDGKNHVGDTIEYTITVQNNGDPKSTWKGVQLADVMPLGVTFQPGSVKIDGEDAGLNAIFWANTLTVTLGDLPGGTEKVVTFQAKFNEDAYGQQVKNSVTAAGEDGDSGEEIRTEAEEPDGGREVLDKSAQPEIDGITEGDRIITGRGEPGAEIVVTFPGGKEETVTVDGNGNWTVQVPEDIDLVNGDEVSAIQNEPGKELSDPEVAVVAARPAVQPSSEKTSVNLTNHPDGTNHVGDTFQYKIVVRNTGDTKSLWKSVSVIDQLPEGLTFVDNSVSIDGVTSPYDFINGTLTVPVGDLFGGTEKVVTFEATVNEAAYGKAIKNTATVTGNDGEDKEEIEEPGDGKEIVDKSAAPTINDLTKGDKEVTGTGVPGAEIIVTFPDQSTGVTKVDPSGNWSIPLPDDKALAEGEIVTAVQVEQGKEPSDEVSKTVAARPGLGDGNLKLEKTSANTSTTDGATHVGDRLLYTVVVSNEGPEKSLLVNAKASDSLPLGVTLVPDSVKLDGELVAYDYNEATRLLNIDLGDIPGQSSKTITFLADVNEDAYGKTIVNHVKVSGTDDGSGGEVEEEVDENGGGQEVVDKTPMPTIDEINEGDASVTGTGIPGATVTVKFPGNEIVLVTVNEQGIWTAQVPATVNLREGDLVSATQKAMALDPSDPVDATVQAKKSAIADVTKTSKNISSMDGKTHVGDTIEYTITMQNTGSEKSVWTDVVLSDILPQYVTYQAGSVKLNGAAPTASDFKDGVLSVTVGDIRGGETVIVSFLATINETAYGEVFYNTVRVDGKDNGGEDLGGETTEEGGQKVQDKSKEPVVDEFIRGDESVDGKGEPGADITVTFPDGSIGETTVDENGDWSVPVSDDVDLNNGDEIKVVQVEPDKDPSEEVIVTVQDKSYRAVTGTVYPLFINDFDLEQQYVSLYDIKVELRATFGTPADKNLSTVVVGADAQGNGTFTIPEVPFGTYVLTIERPGYLVRTMMVTITESDPDVVVLTPPDGDVFELYFGDLDQTGLVDQSDIMMLLEVLSLGETTIFDAEFNAACDLDGNCIIDVSDIMMILENINKTILDYPGSENVDFSA